MSRNEYDSGHAPRNSLVFRYETNNQLVGRVGLVPPLLLFLLCSIVSFRFCRSSQYICRRDKSVFRQFRKSCSRKIGRASKRYRFATETWSSRQQPFGQLGDAATWRRRCAGRAMTRDHDRSFDALFDGSPDKTRAASGKWHAVVWR